MLAVAESMQNRCRQNWHSRRRRHWRESGYM